MTKQRSRKRSTKKSQDALVIRDSDGNNTKFSKRLNAILKEAADYTGEAFLNIRKYWEKVKAIAAEEGVPEEECQAEFRFRLKSKLSKHQVYYLFHSKERLEDVKSRKLATSNGNADPDMIPLATQMGDDLMKKIDDEYLEKFGADDEYSLQDIHEYRRKDLYKYDVEYLREMVKYMHTLFELRKKQIEEFKAKTRELEESETE